MVGRPASGRGPVGHRGTLARRSRSRQPGLGQVGRSWQRAGRMVPPRWGTRDHHGAVSGEDGMRQVPEAVRNRHREEGFVLAPKKRPGPLFRLLF